MEEYSKILNKFIVSRWSGIRRRTVNNTGTRKKDRTYIGIPLEMTREEFSDFCTRNSDLILSLKKPSIDRVNNKLGYRIDNLQIIEMSLNCSKDKRRGTLDEMCCRRCLVVKHKDSFGKSNRWSGFSNICKVCDSTRQKEYIKRRKLA